MGGQGSVELPVKVIVNVQASGNTWALDFNFSAATPLLDMRKWIADLPVCSWGETGKKDIPTKMELVGTDAVYLDTSAMAEFLFKEERRMCRMVKMHIPENKMKIDNGNF